MATLQPGHSDEAPYPSYKELHGNYARVDFSPAAKRLFWPFQGVFPTAISVMKTARSPHDLEPYFRPDAAGSGSGTWHEISQLPLTEPKVSSIEASVCDLDQWEFDWIAWHRDHTDGDADPGFDPEYVTYGDLSDEDRPYATEMKEDGSWEEDSDTEFLIRCCDQDRPLRKRGIKLLVTPSAGHDFVTVHDYVSAVHPWLLSLREDIWTAKTVARPQPYPYPVAARTEWMVNNGPDHNIEEKEAWMEEHGGGPTRPVPASTAAFMARIRASRERTGQSVSNVTFTPLLD